MLEKTVFVGTWSHLGLIMSGLELSKRLAANQRGKLKANWLHLQSQPPPWSKNYSTYESLKNWKNDFPDAANLAFYYIIHFFFLFCFYFLAFLVFRFPFAFFCVSPILSKGFRGSERETTLAFFGVSLAFFPKSKGWRVRFFLGGS